MRSKQSLTSRLSDDHFSGYKNDWLTRSMRFVFYCLRDRIKYQSYVYKKRLIPLDFKL